MNKERHVCARRRGVNRKSLELLTHGRETVSAQCLEFPVDARVGEPAVFKGDRT